MSHHPSMPVVTNTDSGEGWLDSEIVNENLELLFSISFDAFSFTLNRPLTVARILI